MVTIEVNNKPIEAKADETILSALKRAGIHVPTLCHMEDLFPSGACRMCVVEVEGMRGLIPSCAYPVADGMKIQTHSPRVVEARKTIIELLLADHPDDCLYCSRNGSCELRGLAEEFNITNRRFKTKREPARLDVSSLSIVRDPSKCILCGRCVRVCEEVQKVAAIDFAGRGSKSRVETAFNDGLNVSSCINCGQCIAVCPTGALTEQPHIDRVLAALEDPEKTVVVQHAPSVSVTLAEEFGMKPGIDIVGMMTAALRKLGFDRVFDTGFSADLTIMEEASELVHRITTGGKLPMMTSCSPGWIKFVEQYYPDMVDNLSSCKSPQQMLGALIKHYWAKRENIDPANVYSVSIMPCTAKKFEAERPEMFQDGVTDVDAVLTTRELAKIIRMRGLDMNSLEPDTADTPFGTRSTAGKLFGATGGVMEAALRTAYNMLTGTDLEDPKIQAVRGLKGRKEAHIDINGTTYGFAVVSGLGNARELLEEIRDGRSDINFIEVMTCPGGCINGGGQPLGTDSQAVQQRMQKLYNMDGEEHLRCSHKNPEIVRIYDEFLEKPLGEKSHHLLHTTYKVRDEVIL